MTAADVPYPDAGTGAEAGALYLARHVVSSPDPLRAARLLQNWIADHIGSADEPQDFGSVYTVFADLGDIDSVFGEEQAATESVRRAAEQWLTAAVNPTRRAAWIDKWTTWLTDYSAGREPFPWR